MSQTEIDLAIIGGGISGLGIAWEAATRGLRTRLVESRTVARATSDNSLRIIHGGFRYLQQLDLPRIKESIRDQKFIAEWAPDLVKPLSCLMPLRAHGLKSPLPALAASQIYNLIALCYGNRSAGARILSNRSLAKDFISDSKLFPKGALHWVDALCSDPALLAERVKSAAEAAGAEILQESPCLKISKHNRKFTVTCPASEFQARLVVNATGPWLRSVPLEGITPLIQPAGWCKAFNLVVKQRVVDRFALGGEDSEGRLLFLVPRDTRTAIGTEYLPFEGDPDAGQVTPEESRCFLDRVRDAFPSLKVGDEVEKVEHGVLPLKAKVRDRIILYGAEEIVSCDGYVEVLSTKYTTFRSQARKVVDALLPK